MVITIIYEEILGYPLGYRYPDGRVVYFKQYVNDMKGIWHG
jgi:hypothetical protein